MGLEHWQETIIVLLIAYSPVILIANVPGIAASSFDVRFGARRLSQREMDIIAKVERVLEDCASKSGVKLPRAVWRVQDTGEINAYAYAHNRVCFTKGILHKYSDTEAGIERLAGVAAHELGHLRNWDTRINMYLHYLSLPVNFGIGLTNNTLGKMPFIGLVFMLATVLFRIPSDIAHMLNGSVSTFREYQADRFAAKLMNGVGISGFLDDTTHTEERQGGTFTQWAIRSHPPSELRHDELVKAAN
ncbi:M48 family metalloprotease [Roseibium polysiphoniae]|uniref:M48 family metalloprotease n=1 Tax=Roseibium polysiphoniae TaxID=2571221 RepID=UPI0032990D96